MRATDESRPAGHRPGRSFTAALLAALLAGCSVDSLVGDAPLPSGVNDPATTETPEGALAAYRGTVFLFAQAIGGVSDGFAPTTFIPAAGLLSDELQDGTFIGQTPGAFSITGLDVRLLPEQTDPAVELNTGTPVVFGKLQKVRGQAEQALGLLRDFPPQDSPALQAHVYALDGYSEVLLADLYCSGIPLSTLDYKGDYTLRPGSSTGDVYEHAVALFDAALALSDDSTRFVGLAQIGKGRALLALGRFDEAAAAVQPVVGTVELLKVFVSALRLERFDMGLALRLLKAGQRPDLAVQSGLAVGKYLWWPTWLLKIVTERALAGQLDQETIAALDRCAYAELSPAQARVARRLLTGDAMMIDASADRLETLGEPDAARRLREGDLSAVALAARLIPV